MTNKPRPLNGDYNRDPNIKALERRGGFCSHGYTVVYRIGQSKLLKGGLYRVSYRVSYRGVL